MSSRPNALLWSALLCSGLLLLPGCVWVSGHSDYEVTMRDTSRVGVRTGPQTLIPAGAAAAPAAQAVFSKDTLQELLTTAAGPEMAAKVMAGVDQSPGGSGNDARLTLRDAAGVSRFRLDFHRTPQEIRVGSLSCVDADCTTTRRNPELPDQALLATGEPVPLTLQLADADELRQPLVLPIERRLVLATTGSGLQYADLQLQADLADAQEVTALESRSKLLGWPLLLSGLALICVGELALAEPLQERDFSGVDWKMVGGTTAGGVVLFIWGLRNIMSPRVTVYPD